MNHNRPKNLNLLTIRFPVPAIVSILHRITGVALFLLIPFLLWALSCSLTPDGFDTLSYHLSGGLAKFILWVLLIPLCFHLIAGIRHLLSDIHLGDSLKSGRTSAYLVFILTALLIIVAGIWLW